MAGSSRLTDLDHSGAKVRCECLSTRMDELCGFSCCLEKVYKMFEVGSPEVTCSNRSGTIGAKGSGLTERMQSRSISRPGRYPTGPPLETLDGLRDGPVAQGNSMDHQPAVFRSYVRFSQTRQSMLPQRDGRSALCFAHRDAPAACQ
jgi:hypothetical protein